MRHALAVLASFVLLTSPTFAQSDFIDRRPFADNTPPHLFGGLMIISNGSQTTTSLGGILFPRKVKVTTRTPEGPVVTRFVLPSALHSPHALPLPGSAPASFLVEMLDPFGIIYIEGNLIASHGTLRQLESPPLPPGVEHPLKLRAAFAVGDKLLIEDKTILLRAGESIRVTFDGSRAITVALPTWTAPLPK